MLMTRDRDLFRNTSVSFPKRDLYFIFDIASPAGTLRTTAPAAPAAENIPQIAFAEDLSKNIPEVHTFKNIAKIRPTENIFRSILLVDAGMTVPIVHLPLFRIRQHAIGLGHLLKLVLGFFFLRFRHAVRMVLQGKRTVGFFDLLRGRVLGSA